MASLIRIVVAVLVGVLVGLIITIQSLDQANSSVVIGPWRSSGHTAGGDLDPYVLAANARSGLLPIGTSEGLTFIAATDERGGALSGRCDYVVGGAFPAARFWTLSLLTPEGFPISNAASRYGFTSAEILRIADVAPSVIVSGEAHAGNWLPSGQDGHYVLMLRLYDTNLSNLRSRIDNAAMPTVRRLTCR